MGTLDDFATWAAALRFTDIPPRVVEKARWQQASVVAASFAGLHDPGAQKVVAAARKHGGSGSSRVIAGGFHTARPTAIRANAATSCTFDFDEILLLGHPGHSSVNVPLVLGEELGATWADVVTAQVAANEIAGRLGLATLLGPQNGQMLPYIHCASGAIAAGKLLGLSATQLAHALAVAMSQPPTALWPAFLGPIESKVLIAAQGAAMGAYAAELAADGFTGPLDILDHPRGFFHRFTFAPIKRALGGLGRAWLSDTLQVKLHAACWYYQALLDALVATLADFAARRGAPLTAREVRSVVCRVTFLADAVDGTERLRPREGLTSNEINFSIPAAVALTIVNGRLLPVDLTPEQLAAREAEVRTLSAKVRVQHDTGLTRRLLGAMDRSLDVMAIVGDLSLSDLARAGRALREEFPHTPRVKATELMPALSKAGSALLKLPGAALSRLLGGGAAPPGRKAPYDLGEHDVASLVLPISGSFDIDLENGQRLSGERDIPAGALSLDGAPALVEAKLRTSATPRLGEAGAAELAAALRAAVPTTKIGDLLALSAR